jgi:hypothetical protein
MGGFLNINTLVNGRPLSPSRMRDPFNLRAFPGAVDQMRGKTLDRLGRDIVSAAQMLAQNDPDIVKMNIRYTVESGDLVIHSEQEHATGHQYLKEKALETGDDIYRSAPKNHLLKATLGVLHGKSKGYNTMDLFATDVVKQWRSTRGISGAGGAKGSSPFTSFGTIAGFLSVGTAYLSGIPL